MSVFEPASDAPTVHQKWLLVYISWQEINSFESMNTYMAMSDVQVTRTRLNKH